MKVQITQVKKHESAIAPQNKPVVERQIKAQIEQDNYIIASKKPAIVSSLGQSVPKADGSTRIIHDGSLPEDLATNDYAVRYKTTQDACRMAKQGYHCAKLDLKSAYRSMPVHPDNYKATGLAWRFEGDDSDTFLFDARLPFGLACGPSPLSRSSDTIGRIMHKKRVHRGH